MKPIVFRSLGCLFLTGVIAAFFLPFFESFDESIIHRPLSIISERENPQEGHFGGGYYTTYNGFGSLLALFNFGISIFLFAFLFVQTPKKVFVNTLLALFLLSHLLVFIGMILAPLVLTPAITLLLGYFVLTIFEIGLFKLVYMRIKRVTSVHLSDSDLLDEGIEE